MPWRGQSCIQASRWTTTASTWGPIWDFDRALESSDSRDNAATGWTGGTSYFSYGWWNRLFDDPDFCQQWIDRWQELRPGVLSTTNMFAIIDGMADELAEAQVRNYAVRPGPRFGSWQAEIDHLKDWLLQRATWMDDQFIAPPFISNAEADNITPVTADVYGDLTSTGGAQTTVYVFWDTSDGGTDDNWSTDANWDNDVAPRKSGGAGANGRDTWWVNGASAGQVEMAALNTGTGQLLIGSRVQPLTEGIRGDVAEVLLYDRVLNATELDLVGGYLSVKYGIASDYPAVVPGSTVVSNTWATNITYSSARLQGVLDATGSVFSVRAYWGQTNGTTNASAWATSALLGTFTNAIDQAVSFTATGLQGSTTYYYTLFGSNAARTAWAEPSRAFTTPAGVRPSTLFIFR